MGTKPTAEVLSEHTPAKYQFGPDRLMTVTCECGTVTAADDYLAGNAHVAALEVHLRHQARVVYEVGYGRGFMEATRKIQEKRRG